CERDSAEHDGLSHCAHYIEICRSTDAEFVACKVDLLQRVHCDVQFHAFLEWRRRPARRCFGKCARKARQVELPSEFKAIHLHTAGKELTVRISANIRVRSEHRTQSIG